MLPKINPPDKLSVKAVLFDLDETLIDSVEGHIGAHSAVCRLLGQFLNEKGVQVDEKELLVGISKLDDEMNRKFLYDRDDWWQRLVQRVAPNVSITIDLIQRLTREYWLAYALAAKPYPDTLPMLDYLKKKGYLLGLVSDTDKLPGMKRYRIEIQSFRYLFNMTLVSGEETKETKPSAEPFLVAAEKLGLKPEDCIFVGDKPFADVAGAKNAGMKSVLVHRRDWNSDVAADYVITSLSELENIL